MGVCLVLLVGLTRMWLGVHFLSDVVGGWALGVGWSAADRAGLRRLRRGPGGAAADDMTGLEQRVVLAPDDGSLGPLLRIADDRLAPGSGYGRHEHRAVDVVAVVLVRLAAPPLGRRRASSPPGDVAVLRAGTGLDHDEVAGDDGARVLQCYLRSADPAPAAHEVHRAASGWVDLHRPDARLWLAGAGRRRLRAGGLLVAAGGRPRGRRAAAGGVVDEARGWRWSGSSTPPGRRLGGRVTSAAAADPCGQSGGMPISAAELLSAAYNDADRTIDLRRRLHRHPEIGLHLPADPGDWCSRRSPTCRSR